MEQQATPPRMKADNQKFCSDCGGVISIRAELCPHCGVRHKGGISKAALIIITFFLGGIGAHKFYAGRNWQGVLYMLFFWTGIPGLIAFIEFIIYIFTSEETLRARYPNPGSGGVIIGVAVGFFVMVAMAGILAAIAIPQFVSYRNRAYQVSVKTELQALLSAEQEYYVEYNTFTSNIDALNYIPTAPDVMVEIIHADEACFEAIGMHDKTDLTLSIDCNGFQQD